eukprot:15309479-Alexandrium_andersonii.AAC.1
MGPFLPEGPFDNVMAASGLSWASVRMKAQGVQCSPTLGARESRRNDRHGKTSPRHRAVFWVREAKGSLGRHRCEEYCRPRGGQVSP